MENVLGDTLVRRHLRWVMPKARNVVLDKLTPAEEICLQAGIDQNVMTKHDAEPAKGQFEQLTHAGVVFEKLLPSMDMLLRMIAEEENSVDEIWEEVKPFFGATNKRLALYIIASIRE